MRVLPSMVTTCASLVLFAACGEDTSDVLHSAGGNSAATAQPADTVGQGADAAAPGSMPPPGSSGSVQDAGGACVPLTQWEKMMLDRHNTWRASVSPPAAQMYRVHWDTVIAKNAAKWVASCDPNWPHSPDSTRSNIGGYDILGENLSYCAGPGCAALPSITDGSGKGDGDGWWDERVHYDWTTDTSSGLTSHYTEAVSSNVYSIGCATQKCSAPGPGGWNGEWWWTICQYGPRGRAYWVGTKPYDAGPGGLVEPPASVYATHPGLCSISQ